MKQIIAILVGLCLLVQCLAHFAVVGLYELNKSYVAKNLCENRAKPEMNCCGKCVLKKQLQRVDENDQPSGNAPVKSIRIEILACVLPPAFLQNNERFDIPSTVLQTPVEKQLHNRIEVTSIFHPPAC